MNERPIHLCHRKEDVWIIRQEPLDIETLPNVGGGGSVRSRHSIYSSMRAELGFFVYRGVASYGFATR